MATELFRELQTAFDQGKAFAICTVVEIDGSSPGTLGQKMLVFQDGSIAGSVGGGSNEEKVKVEALGLLGHGGCKVMSFDLANPIDGDEPVCGGSFKVFVEVMLVRPRLIIFGGGHIGATLAQLARLVRYQVTVVDSRPDYANADVLPGVDVIVCDAYERAAAMNLVEGDSIVIVTPGHTYDRIVLEKVLPSPAKYVGLVCSARKLKQMKEVLHSQGISHERLEKLFAPIGVNLGSTIPEEIALEILAQLVAFRNGIVIPFQR